MHNDLGSAGPAACRRRPCPRNNGSALLQTILRLWAVVERGHDRGVLVANVAARGAGGRHELADAQAARALVRGRVLRAPWSHGWWTIQFEKPTSQVTSDNDYKMSDMRNI